ncbi:MAG: serine/threonine-protein kinase [Myxococcota bacterium]
MSRIFRREEFPVRWGKYTLLERIGFGGMAEVFRARLSGAAGFQKQLVIKRILPHLADTADIVERFIAEAKLLASVEHKNVVSVYELGQVEEGEYFIAMELVDGADLLGILRRAAQDELRIPVAFSIHVAVELLAGLAFVHDKRDPAGQAAAIIHRDVSPSNVFVSRQAAVKLGDFGVAKSFDLRRTTHHGGQLVRGKLEYTAPELLFGQRRPDRRVDLFGVGAILWEMLAQRRLFGGDSDYHIARQLRSAERPRPSRYQPDVPEALDPIVLKALASDPDQRYQSARELSRELIEVERQLEERPEPEALEATVRAVLGEAPGHELSRLASSHRGFRGGDPALKSFAIYFVDPAKAARIEADDSDDDTLDVRPSAPPLPGPELDFDDQKTVIDPRALSKDGPDWADEDDVQLVQPVAESPALDEDVWVELSAIGTRVSSSEEIHAPTVRIRELIDDLVLTEAADPIQRGPKAPAFWLRGPLTSGGPQELGAVLGELLPRRGQEISLDGERFVALNELLAEADPKEAGRPNAQAISGTFPRQSPVLLFCRLARASASGAVLMEGVGAGGAVWTMCAQLAGGRLIEVSSTRPGDGLLEILLGNRGLSLSDGATLLAASIQQQVPLLAVAARVLSTTELELRTEIYRHRLMALFSPAGVRFRFSSTTLAPSGDAVDPRPLFAELLLRADPSALRGAGLAQLAGQRIAFAQSFVREIRGFRLTRNQDRFLMALAEGRRPELGSDAREELAIVAVLVASGLLLLIPAS